MSRYPRQRRSRYVLWGSLHGIQIGSGQDRAIERMGRARPRHHNCRCSLADYGQYPPGAAL